MVVHPDGQWSELDGGFLYVPTDKSTLVLQSARPAQGGAAGSTDVLLSGAGFATGMLVFFDYAPVLVAGKGAKAAAVVTPSHAPGQVTVHATSPDGSTVELAGGFVFVLEQPYVAAVSPPWGAPSGGSKVVVTGKGFHPKAKVTFGGIEGQVATASSSALVCNKDFGYCSECVSAADCGKDNLCVSSRCVKSACTCASSKECTNFHVCSGTDTRCVACESNADCTRGAICSNSTCAQEFCKPGASKCKNDKTLFVCAADGLSYEEQGCPSGKACKGNFCL